MQKETKNRHSIRNLLAMLIVLVALLIVYVKLKQTEILDMANFEQNQQVAITKGKKTQVGIIEKAYTDFLIGDEIKYRVRVSSSEVVKDVLEEELELNESKYKFNQIVELQDNTDNTYHIDGIEIEDNTVYYHLLADNASQARVSQDEIVYVYNVPLKETNTAAENNDIIQESIELSKDHKMTVLNFPQGRFKIGSHTPEEEYIVLSSNLELRGNDTTLIVDGSARWFGLTTGPEMRDGVNNLYMTGFHIRANDLVNGNQFIMMLNHGYNINVDSNVFTLVHQMSSHIFDLGGVELARFTNNKFIGYAPALASVTEMGDYSHHNIYAEAIQTDYSDGNGAWDGGLLEAIDENYYINNPYKWESKNIEITNNELLPYRNADGKIIAYSATLGQHSSNVSELTIAHNTIEKPLVYNFPEVDVDKFWYFAPVHAKSEGEIILEPNTIIE